MVKTELELPESVEEFLSFMCRYITFPVMMKGGRLLKVSVELIPRYACNGDPMSEDATECPVCKVVFVKEHPNEE